MLQIINDTSDLLTKLTAARDRAGRSELGRQLAIATTDAERLLAWLRHTNTSHRLDEMRAVIPEEWTETGSGYHSEGKHERAEISGLDQHGRTWTFRYTSDPLAHRYRVAVVAADDAGQIQHDVGYGTSPDEAINDLLADCRDAVAPVILGGLPHPCASAD